MVKVGKRHREKELYAPPGEADDAEESHKSTKKKRKPAAEAPEPEVDVGASAKKKSKKRRKVDADASAGHADATGPSPLVVEAARATKKKSRKAQPREARASEGVPAASREALQEGMRLSKQERRKRKGTDAPGSAEKPAGTRGAPEAAEAESAAGKASSRAAKRNKRKRERAKENKQPPPPKAEGYSAEAEEVLRSLDDSSTRGTLSDRLNPTHSCYDKLLQERWKNVFTKREKSAIAAREQARLKDLSSKSTVPTQYPYEATEDDHCETALDAYRDVAPLLAHLAESLGKTSKTLRIYDPYFCAGAVVKHLGELGFADVYNRCEDFYAVQKSGQVPPHDVVVTNPPYSGDHVEKLLRWCRSNGKPFFLLMPNYFCHKVYYEAALGGPKEARKLLYLYPRKRYAYWTPKGLRAKDRIQKQHSSAAGNRTSPFVSFWYLDLAPVLKPKALARWWASPEADVARQKAGLKMQPGTLCGKEDIPSTILEAS